MCHLQNFFTNRETKNSSDLSPKNIAREENNFLTGRCSNGNKAMKKKGNIAKLATWYALL